jgi:ABC-type polysaccharide/polyol phosphate export permease
MTIIFIETILIVINLKLNFAAFNQILFVLLGHGFFISVLITTIKRLSRDKTMYQNIIIPLIFILGLLGGAFWDLSFISGDIKWITAVSPLTWTLKHIQVVLLGHYKFNQSFLYWLMCILFMLIGQTFYSIRRKEHK